MLTHVRISEQHLLAHCGYRELDAQGSPAWRTPTTCFGCITRTWLSGENQLATKLLVMGHYGARRREVP